MAVTSKNNMHHVSDIEIPEPDREFINESEYEYQRETWDIMFSSHKYDDRYKILGKVYHYVENVMLSGYGLYVWGPPGVGKTSLLKIFADGFSSPNRRHKVFNAKDIANEFNLPIKSGNRDKERQKRFEILMLGARLPGEHRKTNYRYNFFLDDIDNEPPTVFYGTRYPVIPCIIQNCHNMFEIFKDRAFFTSNKPISELSYDDYIKDRMRQMLITIKIEGKSSR